MNQDFVKAVNEGLKVIGHGNRSQFIRDAIIEKLARQGICIPENLASGNPRFGKADQMEPVRIAVPHDAPSVASLPTVRTINSDVDAAMKSTRDADRALAERLEQESSPSSAIDETIARIAGPSANKPRRSNFRPDPRVLVPK